MRTSLLALSFAVAVFVAPVVARADLGPPPTCEDGSHDQYLYGHHCVKDGYHLEPAPSGGGFLTVKDGTNAVTPPPTTLATTAKSAPASASASASAPAPTPDKKSGCAYGPAATDAALAASLFLAAFFFSARRRLTASRRARG